MSVATHEIRSEFTASMSKMYRKEVPLYEDLLLLVKTVNHRITKNSVVKHIDLKTERHGAIRLGTADELSTMCRLFAVMGMFPVDYYDLSVAGIPVHSTAFRAIDVVALKKGPFRIFTSLLRLDLIEDEVLRKKAEQILEKRHIFSDKLLRLIKTYEENSELTKIQASDFVDEALQTFHWHELALVEQETYEKLNQSHRLIADVVSFKGPHINHLTPTTLDIDSVQEQMKLQGFKAKDVVEGPPFRKCPILLRQTSFIALDEPVLFLDNQAGTHTARFGEIEQRGVALTKKGRLLYDQLLDKARSSSGNYQENLKEAFSNFPDTHEELKQQNLAFYQFSATSKTLEDKSITSLDDLIEKGYITYTPITYEDFLPVSAAGIFQSNLSKAKNQETKHSPNQARFEKDLGRKVIDSFTLYKKIQTDSLQKSLDHLNIRIIEA